MRFLFGHYNPLSFCAARGLRCQGSRTKPRGRVEVEMLRRGNGPTPRHDNASASAGCLMFSMHRSWVLPRRDSRAMYCECVEGKWSGRPDLNRGPHAPQACALPDCATPRQNRPLETWGRDLQIQRYHLVSSSVKKLRSASRKSSSILRFSCVASVSPLLAAALSPGSGSVALPFSRSRKWRRAPAMVKPSS